MPTEFTPAIEGILDCTLASETSNSYCNTEYADSYWASHFDATKAAQWAALSYTQKQALMVRACRVLEGLRFTLPTTRPQYAMTYDRRTHKVIDMNLTRDPVRYFYYQNLQFPRNLDIYYDTEPAGALYMRDEICMAQCEQAVYILNFDESAIANRLQGLTMEKIGVGNNAVSITQEYGSGGSSLSPTAYDFVRSLVIKGGKMQRA